MEQPFRKYKVRGISFDYKNNSYRIAYLLNKGENEIVFTALDMRWDKRLGLFAPEGLPDYGDADAGQRLYGFFSDGDGLINGEDGYYFY